MATRHTDNETSVHRFFYLPVFRLCSGFDESDLGRQPVAPKSKSCILVFTTGSVRPDAALRGVRIRRPVEDSCLHESNLVLRSHKRHLACFEDFCRARGTYSAKGVLQDNLGRPIHTSSLTSSSARSKQVIRRLGARFDPVAKEPDDAGDRRHDAQRGHTYCSQAILPLAIAIHHTHPGIGYSRPSEEPGAP